MSTKKWYIGERHNPQLPKPYYKLYGQLTKKEVKEKENNMVYGSMRILPFDTESQYNEFIEKLKENNQRIC